MNCRPPRQIGIAVGLVSAVVLAIPPSTRGQGAGVQAFTGATLIDGNGGRIDKAVLVIRDGRVVSAGRSGAVPVPKEARQIPLAGKFVIPGLISAHVHVSDVQGLSPRAYTEENTRRQLGVFARSGLRPS
jgi:imidazolonepropionase-like amidohydrolase